MNSTHSADASWLLEQIQLQLEDIELEQAKVRTVLYLDASEVCDAVLGLQAYYRDGLFDENSFRGSERPLVVALASAGWLGPFSLLAPHQAEFFALFERDFGAETPNSWTSLVKTFLTQVRINSPFTFETSTLSHLEPGQLLEFVRQQAGKADVLFKALQCINGDWRRRLVRWQRDNLLCLNDGQIDYYAVVKSREFGILKTAFDQERPGKHSSNFADAVAICLLIRAVELFKQGEASIPRFFVPAGGLFERVMRETSLTPKLAYQRDDGGTSSVFRSRDYFVLKATFRPPFGARTTESIRDELRKLSEQLHEIHEAQHFVDRKTLESVTMGGRSFPETVKDLREFYFLENVWLKTGAAVKDVEQAAKELVDIASQLDSSSEFHRGLRASLDATKRDLRQNAHEYRFVKSLWRALDVAVKEAHEQRLLPDGREYFKHFGLVRFGIATEVESAICKVFDGLFSEDEESERDAKAAIVKAFRSALQNEEPDAELIAGAGAIWAAKGYDLLVQTIPKEVAVHDNSLCALIAAAALEKPSTDHLAPDLIRLLEGRYKFAVDAVKARLGIALAYLHFHSWLSLRRKGQSETASWMIVTAIDYARTAAEFFDGLSPEGVYAINQYLYYSVEHGDDRFLDQMEMAADRLSGYKADASIWQYRYDDTLGRYFLFLAQKTPGGHERDSLVQSAVEHARSAVALGGESDQHVREFRTRAELTESKHIRRKRLS